jgi:YidC/Oxa1 family membrane protein insertase
MENSRLFIWASLAFVLFLIFQQWQRDYAPDAADAVQVVEQDVADQSLPSVDLDAPRQTADGAAAGTADELPSAANAPSAGPSEVAPVTAATSDAYTAMVETDVLRVLVSSRGGDIVFAELLEYSVDKGEAERVVLLQNGDESFSFQSGLSIEGQDTGGSHLATFEADQRRVVMSDGDDAVELNMTWVGDDVTVTKTYRFERGSYLVSVTQEVSNRTDAALRAVPYVQLQRRYVPIERSLFSVEGYSFRGPVFFEDGHYEKMDPEDLAEEPLDTEVVGGWTAIIQHYFVTAVLPESDAPHRYQMRMGTGDRYVVRTIAPMLSVPAAGSASSTQSLYVGPKTQDVLEEIAPGLELVVDYGTLHLISKPLFILMSWFYSLIGNWGFAIILVTLSIKIVFYKLSETSGRSMAKMRKMQPRLKLLQERYKDDKQKLNENMMKLYQEEKINPAAGCLPILIQLPVFLALYWVLLESVELRQAPFLWWLQDLSSSDPYFVLPILMGASMLIQQKLNPAPPDPVQAKVMMVLPVVFTAFFAFFPSGLVLYWFTNNLLSIAQQYKINKVVEAEK